MDEISQVRSNNWIQLIHARQESGLTVKDWCSQNNVSLHAYYYWLRKLRKQALQEAGITSAPAEPSGTPQLVKVPEPLVASQTDFADDHFALRIRHGNDLIEVGNHASGQILSFLREVLSSC